MSSKLFVSNASTVTCVVQVTFTRQITAKKVQLLVEPKSGPAYLRTFDEGEWKDGPLT